MTLFAGVGLVATINQAGIAVLGRLTLFRAGLAGDTALALSVMGAGKFL